VDINTIALPKKAINIAIPSLFLSSEDDTVVPFKHTMCVYAAYRGPKTFMKVYGEHNEVRTE
jgi:fermentation-respiration switch protein FrsA (DUF1100 family)